jgi:protocatechuate 3,4-dioxygenase beta subunit
VPKAATRHRKHGYAMDTAVVATAPGYFPGWATGREDVALRLTRADAKVAGRVVTLEGRPVAGATVRVTSVVAPVAGTLDPWLEAVRVRKEPDAALLSGHFGSTVPAAVLPGVAVTARTGADGRFELGGYGRDLRLRAVVEGPGIATRTVGFVTRDVGGESVLAFGAGSPIYGAGGTVAAVPNRPITGVVRDRQTGEPLPSVVVQSVMLAGSSHLQVGLVRTRTGADGRYTLLGMPAGEGNRIAAAPETEQAHLPAGATVPGVPGTAPVTVDFALSRGMWVEGVVRDRRGKPVPHVSVSYFPHEANDRARQLYAADGAATGFGGSGPTGADGKFLTVGLPGEGYVIATVDGDRDLAAAERAGEGGASTTVLETLPYRVRTSTVNAVYAIDVPAKAESFRRDVTLEAGVNLTVTLVGPDGKPVAGARSFGVDRSDQWREEARPGEHRVTGYNPTRPRTVLFRHAAMNLVGRLDLPADFASTHHTVEMRPGVTLTARVLDAHGKPCPGFAVGSSFLWSQWDDSVEAWARLTPGAERIVTDAEGRFRIPALPPRGSYAITVKSRFLSQFRLDAAASGAKDLGDLQLPLVGD